MSRGGGHTSGRDAVAVRRARQNARNARAAAQRKDQTQAAATRDGAAAARGR